MVLIQAISIFYPQQFRWILQFGRLRKILLCYTLDISTDQLRLIIPPNTVCMRAPKVVERSGLETDGLEVPGSIPGRACRHSLSEFSVVF